MLQWLFRSGKKAAPGTPGAGASEKISLALQQHQAGRLEQAEVLYREVLELDPQNVDALHFLGVIAYQQGRHGQAEELISRSLLRNSSNAPAYSNLGNALEAQGKHQEAIDCYRRALVLAPDYVDALVNLGATYRAQGELDQAVSCYRRALELTPDLPTAHSNLGNVLGQQGRLDDAESCLRTALELKPDFAEAHSNLGGVLRNQNRLDEAMVSLQKALLLRPDFTEAYVHLAITLIAMGRPDEAERIYLRALQLRPDSAELKFGLSCVRLLLGDYESGFALYESRLEKDALPQAVYGALQARMEEVRGVPRWRGEPGAGRTLLVWTDQGLGDTLMMMRYFPMLKGRGFDRLVVHVEDTLVRIVQSLPGIDEVVSRARPSPAARVDCHCPLTSLPLLFKTRVETIPGKVPYLAVPEELKRKWADRLVAVQRPRVGLVWAGRSDYPKDALRSVRLEKFSPLFEVPGINFINLQKGREAGQIGETRFALVDFMDACTDMLETAALVEQLDLVVCVDTAVMHLAGALGKPLWLLNRFETEWRWMLDREDSPWYPAMRIFRQRRPDDWSDVMARVFSALSLQFRAVQLG